MVLEYFVGGGMGRGSFRVFYIQVTTPQLVVPRLSSCGGVAVVFQSSSCPVLNPCVPSKGSYRIFVWGGWRTGGKGCSSMSKGRFTLQT